MAWIEVHQSLPKHRKTLRLAALLQCDCHTAVGLLIFLWTWALDNVPASGSLGDLWPEEIANIAGWAGDADVLVSALVTAGWIDKREDGYALHDWQDYAGRLIEAREAERKRSQRRRADQRATAGRPPDDQQTTAGTVPYRTPPDPTLPDPTGPDHTEPNQGGASRKSPAQPIDEQFIEDAIARWGRRLDDVDGRIRRAMNAGGFRGAADQRQYVEDWLEGDWKRETTAKRVQPRNGAKGYTGADVDNSKYDSWGVNRNGTRRGDSPESQIATSTPTTLS
jgi:hypothetical protein